MTPSDWGSRTVAERHAARTDRSGGPDACWPWIGYHTPAGYAHISVGQFATAKAHRVAWVLAYGSIPDEMTIDHLCFRPDCQNPRHMELTTLRENIRRQWADPRREQERKARTNFARGERGGNSRLTDAGVRYIRANYRFRRTTQADLAAHLGVSKDTVQRVLLGKSWTHVKA